MRGTFSFVHPVVSRGEGQASPSLREYKPVARKVHRATVSQHNRCLSGLKDVAPDLHILGAAHHHPVVLPLNVVVGYEDSPVNSHSGPGAFGFHHHARCVAVFGPAIAASEEAVALDPDIPLAQHFHPAGRCVHMYSLPGAVYKPVIPHHGVPGLHQQRPTADILRRVILKHQPSGLGAVGQQIPDSRLRHEISRQLQLRLPGDPVPEHLQDSTGSIGQQGVRPDQLELVPRIGQDPSRNPAAPRRAKRSLGSLRSAAPSGKNRGRSRHRPPSRGTHTWQSGSPRCS